MTTNDALHAVSVHRNELLLFHVLLQLALIVLAGRLGGALAQRCGQSPAVGEILIGLLLGPSLFGWLLPDAFHFVFRSTPAEPMQILSQIGLLLLMFQIGLGFDFGHLGEPRHRRLVVRLALAGLLTPFVLGAALGYAAAGTLSPGVAPLASALFVATAFSITALPILGRIMIEFGLERTPLGVIAISVAAINDVIGWLLLALVTTLTLAQFDAAGFALRSLLVLGFVLLCLYGLRPLARRLVRRLGSADGGLSPNLLGALLALIFAAGICTQQLGIFAIFGGFMAGVMLHEERALANSWQQRIEPFVQVFFLPVFFTYTGLRTQIGSLDGLAGWGWCGLVLVLATLGKFGGTYVTARLSGLNHPVSSLLGAMMNTRALMELIVLNVGYDLGVISPALFTMLVIMALASTVITTPALRHWLPGSGVLAGTPPLSRPGAAVVPAGAAVAAESRS
ncbi:MAG TPA: cation:proton antiporter [Plasticicumulans sp.]|nr:cation:proton antiporter [Plasticicumulans sp.]